MKDKILILVIGILIGAIITTAGFLIYNKVILKDCNQQEMMPMNDNGQMNEPPSMPDGENGEFGENGEEPPSKPDGENGENGEQSDPPEKPDQADNN